MYVYVCICMCKIEKCFQIFCGQERIPFCVQVLSCKNGKVLIDVESTIVLFLQ